MITKLQKPIFFDEFKQQGSKRSLLNPVLRGKLKAPFKKSFTDEEKIRIVIDGQSNVLPLEELCRKEQSRWLPRLPSGLFPPEPDAGG